MKIDLKLLPTQTKFFTSKARYPAYIGGYGAGKTYINTIKGITLSLENMGMIGLVVAPTYRDLRDTNLREWRNQLMALGIKYEFNKTDMLLKMTDFQSEVMFRSADDPEKLKGPNVAWAGIDEVARINEEIWGIVISRVRLPTAIRKQCYVTGTPEGLNWVYDKWVENPKSNDYKLYQAPTSENYHVGQEYVDALEGALDELEIKQKLSGQFAESSKGIVYRSFSREDNVTDDPPLIFQDQHMAYQANPNLPIFISYDFNIDYGRAVIGQRAGDITWIFDELVDDNSPVYTDTMAMHAVEKGLLLHPAGLVVYGDAAGNQRKTSSLTTDLSILAKYGLENQRIPTKNPDVKESVMLVNSLLRNSKRDNKLLIHPRCRQLIRDLTRVRWGDNTGKMDKKNAPDMTHISDALRYYAWQEFGSDWTTVKRNMETSAKRFLKGR